MATLTNYLVMQLANQLTNTSAHKHIYIYLYK